MVMNYGIEVVYNSTPSAFYASPAIDNGPSKGVIECNSVLTCNTRFQDELAKVVDLGFNTVRVGFGPYYRYDANSSSRKYSVNPIKSDISGRAWVDLSPPNYNTQIDNDFFDMIINFLDQAQSAGLKVIIITAEDGNPPPSSTLNHFHPAYDSQAVNDYANYLGKLASKLYNHSALLGYDLWNEPIYTQMYVNGSGTLLGKQDICGYVNTWYDAIKQYDSNHLITLGGAGPDEIFYWDPGIIKLDFYSIHTYPNPHVINNYNVSNGFERFKIITQWFSETSPIPWIIGETGFSADDNTSPAPLDSTNVPSHTYPYMYGSETQQSQFAQQSLDFVRNANGSGYSWWAFQNVAWYDKNSPLTVYPSEMFQNFFGLLHYGDGSSTWYDKSAVSVFSGYLDVNGQPPAVGTNSSLTNYYDPYLIKATLNTSATNAVTGHVYDEKGNPIKNAVVMGSNWLRTIVDSINPANSKYDHENIYTFSKSDGSFEIIPYNHIQPGITNPHRIASINVSAIGAERKRTGPDWPYYDTQLSPASGINVNLLNVVNGYDANVSSETVDIGEERNYYGRNTITTSNLIIDGNGSSGGSSDLLARQSVTLDAGTEIKLGAIAYIDISDAFTDCGDYSDFSSSGIAPPGGGGSSRRLMGTSEEKEIEIQFRNKKQNINALIIPNPNNGMFTIMLDDKFTENTMLSLCNSVGISIWQEETDKKELNLNFNYLSKGIYFLLIKNKEDHLVKKIIIN